LEKSSKLITKDDWGGKGGAGSSSFLQLTSTMAKSIIPVKTKAAVFFNEFMILVLKVYLITVKRFKLVRLALGKMHLKLLLAIVILSLFSYLLFFRPAAKKHNNC